MMLAFDLGGVLLDIRKDNVDPRFFGPHFDALTLGQIQANDFFHIVNLPSESFRSMCRFKNGVQELLGTLQTPFAFWSNINPVHHERLPKNPRDVLSYQIGFKKPDPRFFTRALEIAQTPAHEILFIDDHLENIQMANLFGISTFQVERDFDLAHFMIDRGIR